MLLTKAQFHLIPQLFYLSKEVSPGAQTPLLSWCLVFAACAASPAEEEGREVIKEQKEKRLENGTKLKLIKNLNTKSDEREDQEWCAQSKTTPRVLARDWWDSSHHVSTGLPRVLARDWWASSHHVSTDLGVAFLTTARGSKPARAAACTQLHMCTAL